MLTLFGLMPCYIFLTTAAFLIVTNHYISCLNEFQTHSTLDETWLWVSTTCTLPFFLLLHKSVSCVWNVIVHPTTPISSITFLAFFYYFFKISNKDKRWNIYKRRERERNWHLYLFSQKFGCGLLVSTLNISIRVITHIHSYYIGYS